MTELTFENPFDDGPPPGPSKRVTTAGRRKSNTPEPAKAKAGKCPQCDEVLSAEEMNEHVKDNHYQDVPGKKFEPVTTTKMEKPLEEYGKPPSGYDIGKYRLLHHYSRRGDDTKVRQMCVEQRKLLPSLVVVGIDASWTSPGLAFLESGAGGFLADVLPMGGDSEQEHVAGAANALRSALLDDWEPLPVLAVMERAFVPPNVARSGDSSRKLNLVQGTFLDVLYEACIPCVTLSPTTIKKFATGKGNATKPEVLQAAIDQLGLERSGPLKKNEKTDYDRADALWMAAIAALLVPEFDFTDTGMFFEDEQLEYLNTVTVEDLETEEDD